MPSARHCSLWGASSAAPHLRTDSRNMTCSLLKMRRLITVLSLPRFRLAQLFERALLDDEALAVALRQFRRTGRELRDANAADELQRAAGVGWEADREDRA